jgi:hypothetical protein
MNSVAKYFTPATQGRVIRNLKIIRHGGEKWWFQIVFSVFIAILVLGTADVSSIRQPQQRPTRRERTFYFKQLQDFTRFSLSSSAINTLISASVASLIASFWGYVWHGSSTAPIRHCVASLKTSVLSLFHVAVFRESGLGPFGIPFPRNIEYPPDEVALFYGAAINVYSLGGIGFVQGLYFHALCPVDGRRCI